MPKPQVGQPVPAFSLSAVDFRAAQSIVSPEAMRGKPFVLFIYPRDSTPGCTVESCGFRDLYADFKAIGVEVFGVSRDTIRSHQNFIKKSELPYPLIADPNIEIVGGWELIYDAKMYGKPVTKVHRNSYFVDAEGTVREIWEDVTPSGHPAEVLAFAKEHLKKG